MVRRKHTAAENERRLAAINTDLALIASRTLDCRKRASHRYSRNNRTAVRAGLRQKLARSKSLLTRQKKSGRAK